MECVVEARRHYITGVAMDSESGALLAVCGASGEVLRLEAGGGALEVVHMCESTPTSIAVGTGGELFIASAVDQTVLRCPPVAGGSGSGSYEPSAPYLAKFEGKSFLAPTAVAVAADTAELFFTDAGGPGDSSLANPVGALYRTVQGRAQLVPVCAYGLQQPAALAAAPDGCVFVCEQSANRVLRYTPVGMHYTGCVFARFTGGMGPAAVAVSPRDGAVVVALYETNGLAQAYSQGQAQDEGRVVVLNRDGSERGVVRCPGGGQLRAVAVSPDGAEAYVVHADERTCSSQVYKFRMP